MFAVFHIPSGANVFLGHPSLFLALLGPLWLTIYQAIEPMRLLFYAPRPRDAREGQGQSILPPGKQDCVRHVSCLSFLFLFRISCVSLLLTMSLCISWTLGLLEYLPPLARHFQSIDCFLIRSLLLLFLSPPSPHRYSFVTPAVRELSQE